MYKKNHLSGITTSSEQKSKGKFERQNKAKKDYNERKKKVVVRIQASIIQLLPTDFLLLN